MSHKFQKTVFFLLVLFIIASCAPATPVNSSVPIVQPTSTPINIGPILENAIQIREERTYLVGLKFKKQEYTLDLQKQLENEIKAVHETIVVGQKTYDSWEIGQTISSEFDTAGALLNGEFASYEVTVEDKQSVSQYFWEDRSDISHEITKTEYDMAIQEISGKDNVITVPFSGITATYLLDTPVSSIICETKQPLTRYFLTIKVQNESLTLDFSKMIRNATNVHHIDLEIPKAVYEKSIEGEAWNPDWNPGSLIFSGRFSRLHGYVEKLWTESDPSFNSCTTPDGKELILPVQ